MQAHTVPCRQVEDCSWGLHSSVASLAEGARLCTRLSLPASHHVCAVPVQGHPWHCSALHSLYPGTQPRVAAGTERAYRHDVANAPSFGLLSGLWAAQDFTLLAPSVPPGELRYHAPEEGGDRHQPEAEARQQCHRVWHAIQGALCGCSASGQQCRHCHYHCQPKPSFSMLHRKRGQDVVGVAA